MVNKNEVEIEVKIRYPTSQVFDANRMRHVHHVGGHPGSTPNRSIYYCTVYQRVASRILFFVRNGPARNGNNYPGIRFGLSDNCESEIPKSFLTAFRHLAICYGPTQSATTRPNRNTNTGTYLGLSLPVTAEDFKPWAKAVGIPRSFSSHRDNNKELIKVIGQGGEIQDTGLPDRTMSSLSSNLAQRLRHTSFSTFT